MTIDKILYTNHPIKCIITGPSESGKSVLLKNLILKFINEHDKKYIYSPSLHHLYRKLIKCFSKNLTFHIIPNIFNEDIDIVIEEIVINKVFEKSATEIETYESIEELNYPQEYDDGVIFTLDDRNENELNDPRVQAMFKRSRHNNLSLFIFSQD